MWFDIINCAPVLVHREARLVLGLSSFRDPDGAPGLRFAAGNVHAKLQVKYDALFSCPQVTTALLS